MSDGSAPWNVRLIQAEQNGEFDETADNDAANWKTCAVGEALAQSPGDREMVESVGRTYLSLPHMLTETCDDLLRHIPDADDEIDALALAGIAFSAAVAEDDIIGAQMAYRKVRDLAPVVLAKGVA